MRGCRFTFKGKSSAFFSSLISSKLREWTRCILLTTHLPTLPPPPASRQQRPSYSVATWGIEVKEGLPLFPGWSRKNKGWEAWKPKPRGWQDDGEQDSGFAPEFQIITGFFLFDSLQPGGERRRRMGRASRAFTAIRFHWETAGLQRRGEPPADLRVAARASPQGQGASRCPARQRQLLQRRFQERAVSPGRAPPSCFPRRPQGTVDYRSSLHLPVRRRRGTRWRGPTSPPPPSPRPLHSFRNLPGAEFTVTISGIKSPSGWRHSL